MKKHKIIVGITGASGSVYAKQLLDNLDEFRKDIEELAVLITDNAREVWQYELGTQPTFPDHAKLYARDDFMAPFASGSSDYSAMVVCPCSMGTIGRIASGISDDLLLRAADVMLKEKRKLILVPRETPFNLIHLRNMTAIAEAGGIVLPAIPSFYSKPGNIEELVSTVTGRILSQLGFDTKGYRWGETD